MKEIEYSEWVEGNYIKTQDIKKGDVIKIRSKLYIVTGAQDNDNGTCDIYIQDIYDDYKDDSICAYINTCPGKQMYMPSIDISDNVTANAYNDLCERRAKFLTEMNIKANKSKEMRLNVILNFKDISHDMGIKYSGIKYTDYVLPFRRLHKVSTNIWDTSKI